MTQKFRSVAIGLAGAIAIMTVAIGSAGGQWTNRYPRLAGYGHHVYVEGYELPLVTRGPVDAAASPVDERIAFNSRGWLWILDGEVATRLTRDAFFDSRPAWSPDGSKIAFVRDDTRDTSIWEIELQSGETRELVDTSAIDLDPAYTADGAALLYSSGHGGDLDLWRMPLAGGEAERITDVRGLELRPQPRGDGIVYLAKTRGGVDEIRVRSGSEERVVWADRIASQTRPSVSPDGRTVALAAPGQDGYRLELLDLDDPLPRIGLTAADRLPVTPSWSADGARVLFSEADASQTMRLYAVDRVGGAPEEIVIRRWDWGGPTGRLRVRTRLAGGRGYVAARLNVRDAGGRGQVPDSGVVQFDGQNGMTFFHSSGEVEIEMPVGPARVTATHGLTTPAQSFDVTVRSGQTTVLDAVLEPLWDAAGAGWYSGDHHFHLNYGGPYELRPEFLTRVARAEALDVVTPLTANLHNRFEDLRWWGWQREGPPLVAFAQEIRSHFLGHVGLLGAPRMFWPWIWGPGYSVYGRDDRPNAAPLRHVQEQGGVGYYVHPVSSPDPFAEGNLGSLPVAIVPDALAGELDALEVACLWSDEVGTAELWYRFLNVGIPVAPSAGTDVMTNFYRTMAVGTTRVYVQTGARPDLTTYIDALRAGRSFVTTAPILLFEAGDGAQPGDATPAGRTTFAIDLRSAVPVGRVEVLVNGRVVWQEAGLAAPGSARYEGAVDLPAGGWIAARAVGEAPSSDEHAWPMMGSYAFAHTAPIWIDERGSTEASSRAAAATDLLRALEVAWGRVETAYAGVEIPRLTQRFDEARDRLVALGAQEQEVTR